MEWAHQDLALPFALQQLHTPVTAAVGERTQFSAPIHKHDRGNTSDIQRLKVPRLLPEVGSAHHDPALVEQQLLLSNQPQLIAVTSRWERHGSGDWQLDRGQLFQYLCYVVLRHPLIQM